MTISAEAIALWNAASARLQLTEKRMAELPIELAQFEAVAEAVRPRVVFDAEPADFRVVMLSFARAVR